MITIYLEHNYILHMAHVRNSLREIKESIRPVMGRIRPFLILLSAFSIMFLAVDSGNGSAFCPYYACFIVSTTGGRLDPGLLELVMEPWKLTIVLRKVALRQTAVQFSMRGCYPSYPMPHVRGFSTLLWTVRYSQLSYHASGCPTYYSAAFSPLSVTA